MGWLWGAEGWEERALIWPDDLPLSLRREEGDFFHFSISLHLRQITVQRLICAPEIPALIECNVFDLTAYYHPLPLWEISLFVALCDEIVKVSVSILAFHVSNMEKKS